MKKIFLKPTVSLLVPLPDQAGYLPEAGLEVEISPYWHRRIKDKSVFMVDKLGDKATNKLNKNLLPKEETLVLEAEEEAAKTIKNTKKVKKEA